MKIRVVHWGTGNTGREALRGIIQHPQLELVGLYVTNSGKVGKDAAELCGLAQSTGIQASNNLESLLAAKPDVLFYGGTTAGREIDAAKEMARFLESGTDVATFALISMVYPPAAPTEVREILGSACRKGGSSFFATGSSPGFITLGLVTSVLSIAGRVDEVHIQELVNVSRYAVPEAMRGTVGMGQAPDYIPPRVKSGIPQRWWGPLAHHVADLLGEPLGDLAFNWETALTDSDVMTAFGLVEKGTIGGFHWTLRGGAGRIPITVEQFMRVAPGVAPHWAQLPAGAGHSAVRILVKGRPDLRVDFPIDYIESESLDSSLVMTAMHAVNAIPALWNAAPGVLGPDDLPAGVRVG